MVGASGPIIITVEALRFLFKFFLKGLSSFSSAQVNCGPAIEELKASVTFSLFYTGKCKGLLVVYNVRACDLKFATRLSA